MSHQSFLDPSASRAAVGEVIELPEQEEHHARVKRLAEGEPVDVVDGQGLRLLCHVVSEAQRLRLRVVGVSVEQPDPVPVRLTQALAKGDRDLQAVETCVEVGVAAVTPWQAERSIVRWKGDRALKGLRKWESQVLSAVKQSRRSRLPPVLDLVDSRALATRTAGAVADGALVLVLHEEAERPLTAAVGAWVDSGAGPAGIELIVGPEGGIAPAEVDSLVAAGATPVSVGTSVLRSSTAGAVGLVLSRAALGLYD